jgi:hypothetical protein
MSNPLKKLISVGSSSNSRIDERAITVETFLNRIKNGTYGDRTNRYREALATIELGEKFLGPESNVGDIKAALPAALFGGTFTNRASRDIETRSGLICMDVDDLHVTEVAPTREKLKKIPQVLAAFLSPGGLGFKILFVGDETSPHIETFRAASKLLADNGISPDPSGKDLARLCYASYDPDIYVNPEAEVLSYAGIEPADSLTNPQPLSAVGEFDQSTPGNDYDTRGDFPALLIKHGWKDLGNKEWQRPGQTEARKVGATLGFVSGKPNGFYVFSSNAKPLEAGKTYRPWHVFAIYECGGDYRKAAGVLREMGYGKTKVEELPPVIASVMPTGWVDKNELDTPIVVRVAATVDTNRDHLIAELKAGRKKHEFAEIHARYCKEDPFLAASLESIWKGAGLEKATLIAASKVKAEILKERASEAAASRDSVLTGEILHEIQKDNPLFFLEEKGVYYRKIGPRYAQMPRIDALLELACQGLSREKPEDALLSPAEDALNRFQRTNGVDAAGPLCGRNAGLHLLGDSGLRFLVTQSPIIVAGKEGEWPTIRNVLETMLGVGVDPLGMDQVKRLMWWINHGRQAMADCDTNTPGHALFLIGPKNAGKTLLQSAIVRACLGGREADPLPFMTEQTTFNSDLWKAELLGISDGVLGKNPNQEKREAFKSKIKALVANVIHPFHPKNREMLHLMPIWRIILSFNDDHDSMQNIPTVSDADSDSFSDKCLMFQCYKGETMFFDPEKKSARRDFMARIASEIPAFIHAVEHLPIDPGCADSRMGFKAWHHPKVLDGLAKNHGEEYLDSCLAEWLSVGTCEVKAKLSGTRGRLCSGELPSIYEAFKNFVTKGDSELRRDFSRRCSDRLFAHSIERKVKDTTLWGRFIKKDLRTREEGVRVTKDYVIFGAEDGILRRKV